MSRLTKFIRSKIYGDGPDPNQIILDEVDARTMMKSYDAWNRFGFVLLAIIGIYAVIVIAAVIGIMAMLNIVIEETNDLEDMTRVLGSFMLGIALGISMMVSATQTQLREEAKDHYEKDMEEWLSSRKS